MLNSDNTLIMYVAQKFKVLWKAGEIYQNTLEKKFQLISRIPLITMIFPHLLYTVQCLFLAGSVRKLGNHLIEFGYTDVLCCYEDKLVSSGYNIDQGLAYINGKHTPHNKKPNPGKLQGPPAKFQDSKPSSSGNPRRTQDAHAAHEQIDVILTPTCSNLLVGCAKMW